MSPSRAKSHSRAGEMYGRCPGGDGLLSSETESPSAGSEALDERERASPVLTRRRFRQDDSCTGAILDRNQRRARRTMRKSSAEDRSDDLSGDPFRVGPGHIPELQGSIE